MLFLFFNVICKDLHYSFVESFYLMLNKKALIRLQKTIILASIMLFQIPVFISCKRDVVINEIYPIYYIFPNSEIAASIVKGKGLIIYNIKSNVIYKIFTLMIDDYYYTSIFPVYFNNNSVYFINNNSIYSYNIYKNTSLIKIYQLDSNIIVSNIAYSSNHIYFTYTSRSSLEESIKSYSPSEWFLNVDHHLIATAKNGINLASVSGNILYYFLNNDGYNSVNLIKGYNSLQIIHEKGNLCVSALDNNNILVNIKYNDNLGRIMIYNIDNKNIISNYIFNSDFDNCYFGNSYNNPMYIKMLNAILMVSARPGNLCGSGNYSTRIFKHSLGYNNMTEIPINLDFILPFGEEKSIPFLYDNERDRFFGRVCLNGFSEVIIIDHFIDKYLK